MAKKRVRRKADYPWIVPDLWPLAVPVGELKPDPQNARTHGEANVRAIAASLKEYGQVKPLVVNRRNKQIVAGNGTLAAARSLGWTHLAVVWVEHDKSKQVGLSIADNRTAELAEWDDDVLAVLLDQVEETTPDLYTDLLLADLRAEDSLDDEEAPEPQIDRAAELEAEWKTELGQLWEIPGKVGSHRLLCGDATKAEDVGRLMGEERAGLMNTDPPYGIDYAATKNGIPRSGFRNIQSRRGDIANDGLTDGALLQQFLESAIRAAVPYLTENPAFYLWHPMLTQGTFFAAAAAAADILIHRQIIWVKPHFVLTRSGMYHWKHELCFFGWIKGKPCPWYGDKSQTSVWEIGESQQGRLHHTQKPVELFARPMRNHTREGEVVYEPFSGSGSQFLAAEQLGRICYGIEIEPKYVAVCLQRMKDMGLESKLTG